MPIGKTIQIYLPEGNPRGIKVCDINTSIVKGILIPRNKIDIVQEFEDLSIPALYFLITEIEEVNKFDIYIGEAENVLQRLKQHDRKENDWNKAIVFTSSKNNLNKAHYRFLEKHCYNNAKERDRCKVINSTIPTGATITLADKDLALNFFEDLEIVFGTLGYPIFEKIKAIDKKDIFYCRNKDAEAKGTFTDDGFIVYKDSTVNIDEQPSAPTQIKNLRQQLKEDGILVENVIEDKKVFMFSKDFIFGSPSTAGAVIIGGNANGWIVWKDKDEKTLDEIKRQKYYTRTFIYNNSTKL